MNRRCIRIILIVLLLGVCSSPFFGENKLSGPVLLHRYSFTNSVENKVFFEFHYDEETTGLDKENPLHRNQMFIVFDILEIWNTYVGGEFNMGSYIDNKPFFDAFHFAPLRINSISFYEIINGKAVRVVEHNLDYVDHSVLGSCSIAGFDTEIFGSETYNHWPGGMTSYRIKYPKDRDEIHFNLIKGMGGADFGSYYIGVLDPVYYITELYKAGKTPEKTDVNKRTLYGRFMFSANKSLVEKNIYNDKKVITGKKIYSYRNNSSPQIDSIRLISGPDDSIQWERKYEYNKKNQLIRIILDGSIINEYTYNTSGLLERDLYGIYEWKIPGTSDTVKAFVTASSYIDWKNMYVPCVVFDDNPETGWLEASPGSGVGQNIIVMLDKEITIDEIKIMPGYFAPQWWKANNRVKKLHIDFGDKDYTVIFQDKMEVQVVKLPQAVNCKKVIFTIKEVYGSSEDNDTGISEISFYNKGEKVELNCENVK